jgi:hypothetical protein
MSVENAEIGIAPAPSERSGPPAHHPAKVADRLAGWPAFIRELDATLAVHAQYVLWGNLRDAFPVRDPAGPPLRLWTLHELLWEALRRSGYACLIVHDPIDGIAVHPAAGPEAKAAAEAAKALLGSELRGGQRPSLERLRGQLAAVARPATPGRAAFVLDYASRISRSPTELEVVERDFFVACEKLSRTAVAQRGGPERPAPLYNPVIWLVQREGDLPAWLTADNERIRSISVPRPDFGDRRETAALLVRSFPVSGAGAGSPDAPDGDAATREEVAEAFAELSEGLTLQAMIEVTRLGRERGLSLRELPEAVRTYKLGVLDNPWKRDFLHGRIRAGEQEVPARVIGQPQAVTKTLDILKRAALGLSGAQAARSSTRPRGVLFFAGPTGVGKTELAKSMSSLIFGDERAYLRFDMSEFSAEHAGDRLIGAPPGYVGYEQGGELTNAVRQQPFRVILFDEIEKAHPRILDKFLQILEDGRLTDGRGTTAHFSESILVFTSNLGMAVDDGAGGTVPNVEPGMPYDEIERRIKQAISDHFALVLNRPELLNRFGDNIVVFGFIGPGPAERIFSHMLGNIVRLVSDEHGITLALAEEAEATLRALCTADLAKGGRGIGMALESNFVNPLARALFDRGVVRNSRVEVTGIRRDGAIVSLEVA